MPSRALPLNVEGFGLTYLEAAACGVPSIGGKNSGAEDAIVDGETGLLVEAESPEAIAQAIDMLFTLQNLSIFSPDGGGHPGDADRLALRSIFRRPGR